MKDFKIVLAVFFLVFSSSSSSFAEKKKWSIEGHYKHFEEKYSPKVLFNLAERAAVFISRECKKRKKNCDKAVDVFNKPISKWNNLDAMHPQLQVNHTDSYSVVAHPNPKLHKIRFIPDLGKKMKDHHGRYAILAGFNKLKSNGKAAWFDQYSTWMMGVTKLKQPLYGLSVLVAIPETPYHIQAAYPYRAYSIKEIDAVTSELDKHIDEWSIIK